jgi:hypothetical protein
MGGVNGRMQHMHAWQGAAQRVDMQVAQNISAHGDMTPCRHAAERASGRLIK